MICYGLFAVGHIGFGLRRFETDVLIVLVPICTFAQVCG
jgi:hypothetical protein